MEEGQLGLTAYRLYKYRTKHNIPGTEDEDWEYAKTLEQIRENINPFFYSDAELEIMKDEEK